VCALSAVTVALPAGAMTACPGGGNGTDDDGASRSAPADSSSSGKRGSDGTGGSGRDGTGTDDAAVTKTAGEAAATSDRCAAGQLGIEPGAGDPGAGNIHYRLTLTDKGSGSRALQGFPGVSLPAEDGSPTGTPAKREGGAAGSVRLRAGQSAHATLHTLNKSVQDGSCWDRPSLLRVHPPGSKDAVTLRTGSPRVCGDTFTVTSLR